jgi:hypothetical protein
LGQLGVNNLPTKTNIDRLRGLDACTGKSNFDIAEWMLVRLIQALPDTGVLAMLCKTMTARKVLRHFWKMDVGVGEAKLFVIDAKAEFGVCVDACLFVVTGRRTEKRAAKVFSKLDLKSNATSFGYVGGNLVTDIKAYKRHKNLDGGASAYTWRSGVKHDSAKIMEFVSDEGRLTNGLGETVDIEPDYVYPLLKSSDIGNGRHKPRKAVLVTQNHTGQETAKIATNAPMTWGYLLKHGANLDRRRSSIYKNRPRFSIFGVGPYSFSPWKVAISALYKDISFVVVPPCNGRPVMVDDTCYTVSCDSEREAELIFQLLSSAEANEFLRSLIFWDSKRPITIDVLSRLSLVELARYLRRSPELERLRRVETQDVRVTRQIPFLMEPRAEYKAAVLDSYAS